MFNKACTVLHFALALPAQHQQVLSCVRCTRSSVMVPCTTARAGVPVAVRTTKHSVLSPWPRVQTRSCPLRAPAVQVLETLKDPLQTLIQGREAEVVYAVLSNFLVLAQRYPLIFSQVRAAWLGGWHSWPLMTGVFGSHALPLGARVCFTARMVPCLLLGSFGPAAVPEFSCKQLGGSCLWL